MIKLCINDYLLVKQTATTLQTLWQYRIRDIAGAVTVASETGLTVACKKILLSSTTYTDYIGKSLLLQILTSLGVVIEQDEFLISGIYNKFDKIKLAVGLLGENIKELAENDSDWQDGYNRAKVVTTYTDTALTTTQQAYNYTQAFVTDFTPDHRYHISKIKQKES